VTDRITDLLPAAAGGAVIAALYLAALWASVRALAPAGRPGAWLLAGAFARVALVCAGLGIASQGQPLPLAAALLAFVCVRTLALAVTRRGPHASREPAASSRGLS
jgi:F1F0 ATPase subunit 2